MSAVEKKNALLQISNGAVTIPAGNAKVRVGNSIIHVRFCSSNARAPEKFKFNINPNTLSADYELWVCGCAECYYLMPIEFIRAIYNNPTSYVDRMHPEIRVVSVDTNAHMVTYASGGTHSNLQKYLRATL